jgi:GNAT superfamily N-acetyltransferase
MMHLTVRAYDPKDADAVSRLFADYMREVYGEPNAMTPEVLRGVVGRQFNLLLVVDAADAPIGFAAWRETYDLHNAVAGVEVPDLFIDRVHRGRALAVRLVAHLARLVDARGGKYICGDLVLDENDARVRLARRMTVGFASEAVYLAGQGLRTLAALADATTAELVRRLPSADDTRKP